MCVSEDEFKPKKSDDEGDSDESGSSGEDEEAISDLETESEIDTPVKVWYSGRDGHL